MGTSPTVVDAPPACRFRRPGHEPTGLPQLLTGILFVLKTGIAWHDLPAELDCGCFKACRHFLHVWHRACVWLKLHTLLLAEFNGANQIDWQRALIDASFVNTAEDGEYTGPNLAGRSKSGTKHQVLTESQCIPLTATNVNDVTQVSLSSNPHAGSKR